MISHFCASFPLFPILCPSFDLYESVHVLLDPEMSLVAPVYEVFSRADSSANISDIDNALPYVGAVVTVSLPRLAVETAFFCKFSDSTSQTAH